ncbi:MAG: hypothetical protein KAS72_04300 [Phycisphaerales bacterium]|nr:hypothetical protein [Phycisphaerales bacterium]
MPIAYALFENNITSGPDDYAAMVQISGSADGDDLVQDIVGQGSTVNKPDILAVTAALKLACQRRVDQGILDNLCGGVSPAKPGPKLRSTPAPYLAQAPALKLGVGVDLNRYRDRVSCLLGPDTVLTRPRPHRGPDRTLPGWALDLTEARTLSH